jgi:hypothetical protein
MMVFRLNKTAGFLHHYVYTSIQSYEKYRYNIIYYYHTIFFIHNTSFFYFVIHGRDPTEEETPTGITAL